MSRLFILLLIFCPVISLRAQQESNEKVLNEVFHHTPLSRALKIIQKKYDIKIAYDHALVQNILIDIVLKEVRLKESFERLLQNTPLEYNSVGDNIIIVAKPVRSENELKKSALKIAGRIFDLHTGETLPNAAIRVSGTSLATVSNADGYYTILHIPGDTFSIDVSYMGYITRSVNLNEVRDPLHVDVALKDDTKILDEVVLTDEYNQAIQIENTAGGIAFNPRSLNSLPSLGEQDIFRTMQLMPGVSATDESSSGMSIRGMRPDCNLVLLDGMTIYQQDHFFGAFSIINSDIIKDVRVHKGFFDARFGGRVSGIVDITTKNGNTVKPAFNIRVNAINVKATAEIPVSEKLSLFVAARRSFTDAVRSELYKNLFEVASGSNDQIQRFQFAQDFFGLPGKPSYFFYDVNTKLTYRPTDRDIVSLSL
jgi:ferric enterobactin receptor